MCGKMIQFNQIVPELAKLSYNITTKWERNKTCININIVTFIQMLCRLLLISVHCTLPSMQNIFQLLSLI